MAWYTINYSCGHTGRQQLYGKERDRHSRIEWMERRDCPDCWREKKDAEKKRENERAANLANELGFVDLAGSEKQIAWAKSIRQKRYESICKLGKEHPKYGYSLIVDTLNMETSAKWWIDNRNDSDIAIVVSLNANHPAQAAAIKEKAKEGQ